VPKSTSQDALARRALLEDIKQDRRGWLQHGAAALAVSLLGLGVAGSVVLTGNAQSTQIVAAPAAQVSTNPAVALPSAFDRDAVRTTRSSDRAPLDEARLKSLADQRAEELSKSDEQIDETAKLEAVHAREKSLATATEKTEEQGVLIARDKAKALRVPASSTTTTQSTRPAARPAEKAPTSSGKTCLPAASYSIAARFGQVGSWSRYHTGIDFANGVGTTLRAPASGTVTNAGSGPASGWAGNYVAIRYADGTSSLMAHMSTVSVSVGQKVSGCQTVGAIGMTGRTFGPHVHFEIYPAGITPGDVYKAVNPVPWLNAHGLRP